MTVRNFLRMYDQNDGNGVEIVEEDRTLYKSDFFGCLTEEVLNKEVYYINIYCEKIEGEEVEFILLGVDPPDSSDEI